MPYHKTLVMRSQHCWPPRVQVEVRLTVPADDSYSLEFELQALINSLQMEQAKASAGMETDFIDSEDE